MKRIFIAITFFITSLICLCCCDIRSEFKDITSSNDSFIVTETNTKEIIKSEPTKVITSISTTTTTIVTTSISQTSSSTTTLEIETTIPSFSINDVPEYSGNPYVEINNNIPFFTEYPSQSFEIYSPLDNLGRCGVAYANIGIDLMPTEKRSEIGSIKPSGWHTANYSGIIEDIYLYNRCHLIGYQLTGENDNVCNLITGTRYMNVEGMEPFENKVANYVQSYNTHVLYRVTPIFEGDNLVANGVLMEAYSIEDNGSGIKFCVFCYNIQPNIGINYANGDSWSLIQETTEPIQIVPDRGIPIQENSASYILNTNSKKFHYPSCSSVKDMKEKNKQEYSGSRDDLIAMGYEPCKRCNP